MHTNFKTLSSAVAGLWMVGASFGCSHVPVKEIPITANPSEEISKLEARRAEAVNQQVDVLSPQYYIDSVKELAAAQNGRDTGADTATILKHVGAGQGNLDKANEMANVSRTTMPKVVQARADALAANAQKVMKEDFKNADEMLIDATRDVEDNSTSSAEKSRDKLAALYSDIEVKSIVQDKLGAAKATIVQAEKEGAKTNSPRTLEQTIKTETSAESFIKGNRHDTAGIQAQAALATDAANHLLDVSRQVKVTATKDNESVVLEREAQNKQLGAATADIQAKAGELAATAAATTQLKAEKDSLENEKQAAARLDTAKAQFLASEADVYRDGNRLIIRLKSLAFPSGKSTLPTESLAILAKVQKVIRDLGPSHVTIEGHTDSAGAKDANQKLSEARASTVGTYLTTNGLSSTNLTTVGYGDTKPLANNKTKEGRAQNRRVDVIIEPTASAH